jgi:hypothetical protein
VRARVLCLYEMEEIGKVLKPNRTPCLLLLAKTFILLVSWSTVQMVDAAHDENRKLDRQRSIERWMRGLQKDNVYDFGARGCAKGPNYQLGSSHRAISASSYFTPEIVVYISISMQCLVKFDMLEL